MTRAELAQLYDLLRQHPDLARTILTTLRRAERIGVYSRPAILACKNTFHW
jgi:hypothetical protein